MNGQHETSWAAEEFAEVNLGDKRLDARLIKLCDRFSDAPESPINQACADWAETKAAYRFFQNDNVEVGQILAAHRRKTAQRAREHKTVLALQDTSYFVYTSHPKTEGLGKISLKKGKNMKKIYSNGLVVHTCLAVTTDGLPLGLLDQKIFSRKLRRRRPAKPSLMTICRSRKRKATDGLKRWKILRRWWAIPRSSPSAIGKPICTTFSSAATKSALRFSCAPTRIGPSTATPDMQRRASRNSGSI